MERKYEAGCLDDKQLADYCLATNLPQAYYQAMRDHVRNCVRCQQEASAILDGTLVNPPYPWQKEQ